MKLRQTLAAVLGLIILATVLAPPTSAQAPGRKKFAIFISTLGTPQIWTDSGTPQDWKQRGIIDGYLILDQALTNVYQDFALVQPNSQASLLAFLNSSDEVYMYISQCLRSQPVSGGQCAAAQNLLGSWANTDLIIVGHQVGGYVARTLGYAIDNHLMGSVPSWGNTIGGYPASVTVATIATPNQGFRALRAQDPATSVQLNSMLTRVRDVAVVPSNRFYGVTWAAAALDQIRGGHRADDLAGIPSLLQDIQNQYNFSSGASSWLGPLNAQALIGEGGTIPRFVNSLAPPRHYISLYGAEKEYVPVRMAPEVLPSAAAAQFGGVGNESGALNQYDTLLDYYDLNRYLWNNCWTYVGGTGAALGGLIGAGIGAAIGGLGAGIGGCTLANAGGKRDRWATALIDLQTIDVLWAQVVDAKHTESRTGYKYQQACEPLPGQGNGNGPGARVSEVAASFLSDADISADLEPMTRMNYCAPGEDPFQYVPYTYTVIVPEPNDGITGRSYARWSANSQVDQNVAAVPNDARNGNAYYGTDGTNGGYNVMELRRSRRAYGRSSSGGVESGVSFEAGTLAPPLEDIRLWWSQRLLQNPS